VIELKVLLSILWEVAGVSNWRVLILRALEEMAQAEPEL